MPVYNVEDYVAEAIESVRQQSYGEWELLLIDDGSTDESSKICKAYAEKEEKIRYIRKANGGVSSARNRGLQETAGEWIYFMDADDWLDPECFKTIMEYRELESVDIVSWNYYLKEEGCSTKASAIRPERFVETVDEALIREILFYGYAEKRRSTSWHWIRERRVPVVFCLTGAERYALLRRKSLHSIIPSRAG